jgi:hypothetical protein
MQPTDVTVEILKTIRDEVQGLRGEVQGLRSEVHGTNERLDGTNDRLGRLERRQTETEVRLSTELVAVVGAVREVRDVLREDLGLRARVESQPLAVRE